MFFCCVKLSLFFLREQLFPDRKPISWLYLDYVKCDRVTVNFDNNNITHNRETKCCNDISFGNDFQLAGLNGNRHYYLPLIPMSIRMNGDKPISNVTELTKSIFSIYFTDLYWAQYYQKKFRLFVKQNVDHDITKWTEIDNLTNVHIYFNYFFFSYSYF